MNNAQMEAMFAAAKQSIIEDVSNLTPEQAKKLLLHLIKRNDPPGFWQHILARNYAKPEFVETLQ
jgi:hypothetical protein